MKRVLALALMAALIPSTLFAVVPDPGLSITPACIRVHPNGSGVVAGQVIGNNALPLGNNQVRLVFAAACVDLLQCPLPGVQPTVLSTTSNATGNFSFSPQVGGCCAAAISASIEADPGSVTLEVYDSVGSSDNDGTLIVSLADFSIFAAQYNQAGTCSDIDGSCNEFVSLADLSAFSSKFNITCP